MASLRIECLALRRRSRACTRTRTTGSTAASARVARYVGWAASYELDETLRRRLRKRPLERRRLYAA